MSSRFCIGDVYDRLTEIPDGSVDLVVTSPPFLALRSYLPADHPNKAKEIGSEATPADFIDTLLALTAEWGRVLAPHGSLCVELGDTFAGSGGAGGDYNVDGLRDGQARFDGSARRGGSTGWPLDKSLCGIPTLYAWSLAYGRNLLTGGESPAGQWRIRNVIVWARPNPPVGALGDKFRPATSYITVATRARDRWFDLDAVRTTGSPNTHARLARDADPRPTTGKKADNPNNNFGTMQEVETAGAPPLDWHADDHPEDGDWLWKLPTRPYKGAHYATYPDALPRRLVEAMCPREVCEGCGEPRRRVVDASRIHEADDSTRVKHANGERPTPGRQGRAPEVGWEYQRTTLGWTTCDCPNPTYRRGIVLDPFAGSGTTLAVAEGCGRDSIGIDIDERNAELARDRCGMFLEVAS